MLALLLSAALFAPDDTDPVVTPKGTPPTIVVGQLDPKGNLVSEVIVVKAVPVTREQEVNVNGRVEKRTVTVIEYVTENNRVTRDLSKATITDAAGKKIDKKTLAKRLAKPAAVVISADGKPIDKGYLQLFKADTIVIVAPVAKMGVQPRDGPVPPLVRPKD